MSCYKGINYLDYGSKDKKAIVFLHGWGQNIEMMKFLSDYFLDYRLILIDLPGFGKSMEPDYVYSVYDYAFVVNDLLEFLNVINPIMVGHSFGGKVALVYAYKYNLSKLILFAPPFICHKRKLIFKEKIIKWFIKLPHFSFVKNFLRRHTGSSDYRNASVMMRKVLVKHVNTDITLEVSKINVPTLIIWGYNDKAVSYFDGLKLNSLIKDSKLITYFNCGHYAYLESLNRTANIVRKFIDSETHLC